MIEWPLAVLTGAGVSAESGVPTFRGAGGLWRQFRPEDLATPGAFARDPRLVWEWYAWRREVIATCAPNAAHRTLVAMEATAAALSRTSAPGGQAREGGPDRMGPDSGLPEALFTLITQNVDGLHEAAGSRNVLRLHGSIWHLACTRCSWRGEDRSLPLPELPPRCAACGGLLRPGVVWFGESLDPATLAAGLEAVRRARTLLVIGTSGLVYPAAALPLEGLDAGARVVEFNPERTPLSDRDVEFVAGPAAVRLPEWWSREARD